MAVASTSVLWKQECQADGIWKQSAISKAYTMVCCCILSFVPWAGITSELNRWMAQGICVNVIMTDQGFGLHYGKQ